jgi:hypothetical protein
MLRSKSETLMLSLSICLVLIGRQRMLMVAVLVA